MSRRTPLRTPLLAALCLALPSLALANPCGTEERGKIVLKGYEIGQTAIPQAEVERLTRFAETAATRFELCVSASVDPTGSDAANKRVSDARAAAVVKFLTDRGADPDTIKISNVEKSQITLFGLLPDDRDSERTVYVSHN